MQKLVWEKLKSVRSIRCSNLKARIEHLAGNRISARLFTFTKLGGGKAQRRKQSTRLSQRQLLNSHSRNRVGCSRQDQKAISLGGRSTIDRALRVAMATRGHHFTEKKQTASLWSALFPSQRLLSRCSANASDKNDLLATFLGLGEQKLRPR